MGGKYIRGFGVPDYAALAEPVSFSDVSESAWYAAEVAKAAELGIIQGVSGGAFEPDRPVTRAECAAMIVRLWALLSGG